MSKTLQELREHTRVYLDEDSEADWLDDQIDREINYAYMEMYTAVIETYEDYYRTKAQTDVEESQQEYALPSDFFKLRRLEVCFKTGEDRVKATRQDFEQITRQIDSQNFGSSNRPIYQISGNFLQLLPVPTESVTDGMVLWYIKQVPELSANSDTIDIPFADRYGKYIAIGAAAELLRKGQQEETVAAKYDEKFAVGLEKMKQELEDRYVDGSKFIIDTQGDWVNFENEPPMNISIN